MEPTVDGFVLPRTVLTALSTGQFNRVPVIEGSNHDDAEVDGKRPALWLDLVRLADVCDGKPNQKEMA